MKLISWNVNGIRACINKGFKEFFQSKQWHFLYSRNKMSKDQIELEFEGYKSYWNSAEKRDILEQQYLQKKSQ